jgi:hypothetical protein
MWKKDAQPLSVTCGKPQLIWRTVKQTQSVALGKRPRNLNVLHKEKSQVTSIRSTWKTVT